MTFTQTIERLQLIHTLISQRKTGTPEQLANKLGISRSYLYVMLDELKTLNLDVSYSRKYKSFYYEKEINIEFLLKFHKLDENELINFNAGNYTYLVPSSILDGTNLSLHSYFANTKSQLTGL